MAASAPVRLSADGGLEIKWQRIDLSSGGSLGHQLISWLVLDGDPGERLADGEALSDSSPIR